MRKSKVNTTVMAVTAALAGLLALGAPAAQAGVTTCSAQGGKQEAGALVGAALGGLVGNSVSGHNRTTGTVVGAVAGAAAGSAVGCQMQHADANRTADERPATYTSGGYRLSSQIEPARFSRAGGMLLVTRNFDMRAAPNFSSRYVGRLKGGEHVEAMARVRGSDWVLVGRNGVGLGYVHGDYVRVDRDQYASGY